MAVRMVVVVVGAGKWECRKRLERRGGRGGGVVWWIDINAVLMPFVEKKKMYM